MIKVVDTDTGHEYRVVGVRGVRRGEFWLSDTGFVYEWPAAQESLEPFLVVEPIRKRHAFGGSVFAEAGEVRHAMAGEWVLVHGGSSGIGTFVGILHRWRPRLDHDAASCRA